MSVDGIYFIGTGGRNVVFGAPLLWLRVLTDSTTPQPLTDQARHETDIALRFSESAMSECETCLRVLQRFTGPHMRLPLAPTHPAHAALLARVAACAPEGHGVSLRHCREVTVLPNFLVLGCAATTPSPPQDELWTVELKPKATWRPPVVVGVKVGSVTHRLHGAKRRQCRFSLHEHHRGGDALRYCPTLLYRASLSTKAALERLAESRSKYFRVLPSVAARQTRADSLTDPSAPAPLAADELAGLAAALDACGIWAALEALQLYGDALAPPQPTAPVLDIELLYPWFAAAQAAGGADKVDVQWLYASDDTSSSPHTALCRCTSDSDSAVPHASTDAETLRAAPPPMSLEACVAQFYVSTTAKDVSVLISASAGCAATPAPDGAHSGVEEPTSAHALTTAGVVVALPEHGRRYRIGVVDVDDKRVKSLRHYYLQDQAILSSWSDESGTDHR